MGHNALTRAIRHAEARDLVRRNVAMLIDTLKGQAGQPSKSLTLDQASALLAAAEGTRMHAYIALCLATGIRTEEARALRWEQVDLGDPQARPARTGEHRQPASDSAEERTLECGRRLGAAVPGIRQRRLKERISAVEEWLCRAGSETAGMAGQSDRAPGPRLW
jgi:integrase